MSPLAFNLSLHGLVKARVLGPARLMRPVIHEFKAHEDNSPQAGHDLDLLIELSHHNRKTLAPAAGSEQSFAWQGRHLIARWQVSMTGPQTRPRKLLFQGNRASSHIVSKWIVEPALRIAAESKGAIMAHAAALSDANSAVLVAGPAAAGKTTWVLNWLTAGHPFLCDDFSLLVEDRLMSYLTPLRLGARNLVANKVLSGMPTKDKAEVIIRTAIRRALLGYAKFYFKAPIQRAVPGIAIQEQANLLAAVWLADEPETLSPEKMADLITGADLAEMHGFGGDRLDHLASTGSIGFRETHKTRIAAALAHKPCFKANARRLPPSQALASVADLIAWLQTQAP